MADDFFSAIGKKISKGTQYVVDKSNSLVESTKINSQINSEQKGIERLLQKIGESVLAKVETGTMTIGEEEMELIAEIDAHKERIAKCREALAAVKNMKICPSCDEFIALEVAFCPKCGAPTPVQEKDIPEGAFEVEEECFEEVLDDVPDAAFESIDEGKESAEDEAAAAAVGAGITIEAVEDSVADAKETAAGEFCEAVEAVEEKVTEEACEAAETVEEKVEEAGEALEAVEEKVTEEACEAAEIVEEKAEEAGEALEAVAETAAVAGAAIADKADETAEAVQETAAAVEETIEEKTEEAIEAVEETAAKKKSGETAESLE